jgi:predicted DNA-binding transcriptional regulator AlpA
MKGATLRRASFNPGLCREAAAQYVGVSVGKFDQMTKDGRMPKPIRIDGRKVWDRCALDRAFDVLERSIPLGCQRSSVVP